MTEPRPKNEFVRDPSCRDCPLWEGCRTVCVPTVPYRVGYGGANHDTALLIVGEAPGGEEDRVGEPFVGKAGKILRSAYVDYWKLWEHADIYLSNAVRCRPPGNETPTNSQVKACHQYVLDDLAKLKATYNKVVILCVGATACKSMGVASLKSAFSKQGQVVEGCPLFSAYHPAYLGRNPSAGTVVESHLRMVRDFLRGTLDYEHDPSKSRLKIDVAPPGPPGYPITRLSLDIETYGILKGKDQTQFHPVKSYMYDGVERHNMVVTVGLSWRDPDGELQHAIFLMGQSPHRMALLRFLRGVVYRPSFQGIVGQNITFDMMYLRYCFPMLHRVLDWPVGLMDLSVLNYLHDEGRPEKSLKNLAPLFRVTRYETTNTDGSYRQYDSLYDPELWQYNCQDTMATLVTYERMEAAIRSFYGKDTEKLSDFTRKWYRDLLWYILWCSEAGVHLDVEYLERLDQHYRNRRERLVRVAKEYLGMALCGKGSNGDKKKALEGAAGSARPSALRLLKTTPKTKAISFSAENRNVLLDDLPRQNWHAIKLRMIGRYQDLDKLVGSYFTPLLRGAKGGKDISTRYITGTGVVYPRWFPVPSEFDDGSSGGTKQARIVCRGPALQTAPKVIKKSFGTRFRHGHTIWTDASQIELRVAALLSGDPAMMREYQGKPDLHGATAKVIFGDEIVNHPQYKEKYRQAGKTYNFRMLYRGGARKAQETFMKDLGLNIPLTQIEESDKRWWSKHEVLRKWQDGLLDFVQRKGYYTLPLTGQSRLFLGSRRDRESALNEIVNLPVQAVAANIAIDSLRTLWLFMRKYGMKSIIPLNVYDAGMIEVAPGELGRVIDLMGSLLPRPHYYSELCKHLGRSLPLVWEYSVDGGPPVEIGHVDEQQPVGVATT